MIQKRRIVTLALAVVLGSAIVALAQAPLPLQPVPAAQSQSVATSHVDPQVEQAGLSPHPFGMERCETCEGYVCKCEVKDKKKVKYNSVCKPFCLPYCHFKDKCTCEDSCEECGVIAYKKVLVKKNKTLCDEKEIKCVPKPICPPCEEAKK
jgi:hypothetical protein